MRSFARTLTLCLVGLLGCQESGEPHLLGDGNAGTAGAAAPETGESSATPKKMASLDLPILEGRKIQIQQLTDPKTKDYSNVTYSFNGEFSLFNAPTNITWSGGAFNNVVGADPFVYSFNPPWPLLMTAVCSSEIAADSDIIPPGKITLASDGTYIVTLPNPGTVISQQNGGTNLRYAPEYQQAIAFLGYDIMALTETQCDPQAYWKQEMQLCIARHFHEMAEATGPYEISYRVVDTPRAKLPMDDTYTSSIPALQLYNTPRCNDDGTRQFMCHDIGLTLEPASSHPDHKPDLKRVAVQMLANNVYARTCPTNSSSYCTPVFPVLEFFNRSADPNQSDDEIAESLADIWAYPSVVFPLQAAEDAATFSLLAINYYHEANKTGQGIIDCQKKESDPNKLWLDTYDRHATSVAQMVVTNTIDGMKGMIEAGELAQEQIVAAAEARTSQDPSAEQWNQRWRGRVNSRLEALHVWTSLPLWLFETEGVKPGDASHLYPSYPWINADPDVELARTLLRQYRVDPRIASNAQGLGGLQQVLWTAAQRDMPATTSVVFGATAAAAALAKLGVTDTALLTAANIEMDRAVALGWPIVAKNGTSTGPIIDNEPIPNVSPTAYRIVRSTAAREAANVPYLYARSIGDGFQDPASPPNPLFNFMGVSASLINGGIKLGGLAQNMLTSTTPQRPFFPAASTAPLYTTATDAGERDHVALVSSGLNVVATEVPEYVTFCPTANAMGAVVPGSLTLTVKSWKRNSGTIEVWRGEAGYECAMYGRVGDAACAEGNAAYKATFTTTQAWTKEVVAGQGTGLYTTTGTFPYTTATDIGSRVYFTVANAANQREFLSSMTIEPPPGIPVCTSRPAGTPIMNRVRELLSPDPDHPNKPAVCCEGLPCNLAVPLEDTLQSTPEREVESSYQHYLSLARTAAERADALGEEIYRQGLEMDQRAEAARDELESICGGVVNVNRLMPQTCKTDADCCGPPPASASCAAKCQDPDGDLTGYCAGENTAQALADSAGATCTTNADCGTGKVCATRGTLRWCTQDCTMTTNSCPSGQYCVPAGPGASTTSLCFVGCDSDADLCGDGFTCEALPSGSPNTPSSSFPVGTPAAMNICTPAVQTDVGAIDQCLSPGAYVPATLGQAPLFAIKQGTLPLCECRGTGCPPAFDAQTGQPTCPATSQNDATKYFGAAVPAVTVVPINDHLNFTVTQPGSQQTTPKACKALARLRQGEAADLAAADEATVLAQSFMTLQGWESQVAGGDAPLSFQYDLLGYLSITRGDVPWLTTGSVANGPVPGAAFPNSKYWVVPTPPPVETDPTPTCTGTATAGLPLGCRFLGGPSTSALTELQLSRAVELIRLFAGHRRIPIGGNAAFNGLGTPVGNQAPYALFYPDPKHGRTPAPEWLRPGTTNPAANIFNVGSLYGSGLWNNDDDGDVKDDSGTLGLQCIDGITTWPSVRIPLTNQVRCPTPATSPVTYYPTLTMPFNGKVLSEMFRKQTDPSGGARDNNLKEAEKIFDPREREGFKALLDQLVAGPVDAGKPAPVLSGFNTLDSTAYFYGEGETPTPSKRVKISNGEALDALELACMVASIPGGPNKGGSLECNSSLASQTITGPKDFPVLAAKLRCAAAQFDAQLERMWIPQLPQPVVAAIGKGQVTGTFPQIKGEYNITVQDMQGALMQFVSGTRAVANAMRQFGTDIENAQATLDKIANQSSILTWQLVADVSSAATSCASGIGPGSLVNWGQAATCVNAAVQIFSASAIESLNQNNLKIDEKQALRDLATLFNDRMEAVASAADQMSTAYTTLNGLVAKLDVQRNAAERAAAKVLFLDRDSTGRTYNVNTAMRRRMSTLQARYKVALRDAKRMAFVARRSIEQRLAVNLSAFTQDMLLVDKPSSWADTACTMGGIDYNKIRDSGSSPVANTAEDNFSSGYIGDYVTKLENFVESYRFNYPFTDGSDVAVVSVRDDLKRVKAACQIEGPNLLYRSADLTQPSEDGIPGWDDVSDSGATLVLTAAGRSPLVPATAGYTQISGGGEAIRLSASSSTTGAMVGGAYLGQTVDLDDGIYLLSWYEWAPNTDTNADGKFDTCAAGVPRPGTTPGLTVQAIGVDSPTNVTITPITAGNPIMVEQFIGDCFVRWSARVDVKLAQSVQFRFGSTSTTNSPVWAEPQLELVPATSLTVSGGNYVFTMPPSRFFPTSDALTYSSGECEDTTGDVFRTMWESGQSKCDPVCPDGSGEACDQFATSSSAGQQCYHEIRFTIGGSQVERGGFGAAVARSNFNYRYSRFALNLVGTGLRDCSEALYPSSCYAGGFVQYSLFQDPPFTVTNHAKSEVDVNLFPARINKAKALAAERMLTNPLASADRSLLEDYWREDLRGRPLQGNYTLRLYDQVGQDGGSVMNFDKLEDVQLIFDYNYWSRSGE